MTKDEFIGIRVSKEFKKYLQRESKRKGMSLSEYIENHAEDNFKDTKKHIQNLVERAKEERPDFWEEAEKTQITKEFERLIPEIVTDLLHPLNKPEYHPVFMLSFISRMLRSTIVNFDSVNDEYKMHAASEFLDAGQILAENLNKIKSKDKEENKQIITKLKGIIESFVFCFTSMAFAKDSFVKIKDELDKTERLLLKDIDKGIK